MTHDEKIDAAINAATADEATDGDKAHTLDLMISEVERLRWSMKQSQEALQTNANGHRKRAEKAEADLAKMKAALEAIASINQGAVNAGNLASELAADALGLAGGE